MVKVLIADDQELIRQSLKIILSNRKKIEVTDSVANGQEVILSVRKNKPDVILMDVRMPKMDGVQCTKILKEKFPEIKIIILTTFDDDEYIFNALKYGASGYLLKGVSTEELVDAIFTVHGGKAMINPNIATKVIKMFSHMAKSDYTLEVGNKDEEELTRSEKSVIEQVSYGLSNKEVADRLCLSEGTVRNYISTILSKLELRDRTQLAIWAVQKGVGKESMKHQDEK